MVSNYVRSTLNPLIHNMVEKPAACSFELDPSKAGPGEDIEKNADHLRLMCQALLDLICTTTNRVPVYVDLTALCHDPNLAECSALYVNKSGK
jgi:neurofibromin 1